MTELASSSFTICVSDLTCTYTQKCDFLVGWTKPQCKGLIGTGYIGQQSGSCSGAHRGYAIWTKGSSYYYTGSNSLSQTYQDETKLDGSCWTISLNTDLNQVNAYIKDYKCCQNANLRYIYYHKSVFLETFVY